MVFELWTGDLRLFVSKFAAQSGISGTVTHFALPEIEVHATVTAQPGVFEDAIKADPLLQEKMQRAAKQTVEEDLAKLMAYWVALAETEITKISQNPTLTQDSKTAQIRTILSKLPNNLAQTKMQILPKVDASAKRVWEDLCRRTASYRRYQILCGVNIGVAPISLAVSGLGVAAATGPVGIVLGIIGIASVAFKTVSRILDLRKDAFTLLVEVQSCLAKVRPQSKAAAVTLTVARAALPADPLFSSPVKCKDKNNLFGHKIEGLDLESHNLAIELEKALKESDQLQTELDILTSKPQPLLPTVEDRREALSKLSKLEGVIDYLLKKVIALSEEVNALKVTHKSFQEEINSLIADKVPKPVSTAAQGVKILPAVVHPEHLEFIDIAESIGEAAIGLAETFGQECVRSAYELKPNLQALRAQNSAKA